MISDNETEKDIASVERVKTLEDELQLSADDERKLLSHPPSIAANHFNDRIDNVRIPDSNALKRRTELSVC